jgi:hypothetical protein
MQQSQEKRTLVVVLIFETSHADALCATDYWM